MRPSLEVAPPVFQGWPFVVDEGGGAFYGPKIDIKVHGGTPSRHFPGPSLYGRPRVINAPRAATTCVGIRHCLEVHAHRAEVLHRSKSQVRDAIGRKWQCSTVQLDFNLPERFDMRCALFPPPPPPPPPLLGFGWPVPGAKTTVQDSGSC